MRRDLRLISTLHRSPAKVVYDDDGAGVKK